ncbi:hypothetical protein AAVH_20104 [Aphelenchoides avenae]|nr:hypothetical protein AAVH_20104 [Aphelenchus avenae]
MIGSLAVAFDGIIMAAMWRTTGYYYEKEMFWTGIWGGSLITAVPAAVFFVSADRLLIICMPMRYSGKIRSVIAVLSVASIASMTALNFGVNVVTYDLNKVDGCWSFACLTSDESMAVYAVTRFIVALPNLAISVAFLVALYRLNRKHDKSALFQKRKTSDRLALLVVIFELTFDLLPSFVNLVLTYGFDINISSKIGPYRQLTNAANALCCAIAHVKVLRRIAADLKTKRLSTAA